MNKYHSIHIIYKVQRTDTLEKKKLLLNMELDFESFYTHIGKFKSNSNSNHQSDFESHN